MCGFATTRRQRYSHAQLIPGPMASPTADPARHADPGAGAGCPDHQPAEPGPADAATGRHLADAAVAAVSLVLAHAQAVVGHAKRLADRRPAVRQPAVHGADLHLWWRRQPADLLPADSGDGRRPVAAAGAQRGDYHYQHRRLRHLALLACG